MRKQLATKLGVVGMALAFMWMSVLPANAYGSKTWRDASDYAQFVPVAWALGETFYNEDWEGLIQLSLAAGLTLGTTRLLKDVIDAERPRHTPGEERNSFPSGHTSTAWFAAAHVQRRYGCYELEWRCWRNSAIPYIAAGVTAYGRVAADQHNWEDVAASAVLSEAFVYLTTDRFDENVRVAPTFDNGFGIAIFSKF